MSWVTNLLLNISVSDHEAQKIKEVNLFFEQAESIYLRSPGLVAIDDPSLPSGWYGGYKYFEACLYIGAYNYLVIDDFVEHLRSITWEDPHYVQVIVMEQEDFKFRTIDVFPLAD